MTPDERHHVLHDIYDRFIAATAVAKRLNLLDKADRIALFQAVLYANGGEN